MGENREARKDSLVYYVDRLPLQGEKHGLHNILIAEVILGHKENRDSKPEFYGLREYYSQEQIGKAIELYTLDERPRRHKEAHNGKEKEAETFEGYRHELAKDLRHKLHQLLVRTDNLARRMESAEDARDKIFSEIEAELERKRKKASFKTQA